MRKLINQLVLSSTKVSENCTVLSHARKFYIWLEFIMVKVAVASDRHAMKKQTTLENKLASSREYKQEKKDPTVNRTELKRKRFSIN